MRYLLIISFLFLTSCLRTRSDVQELEQKKVIQDQVSSLQKNNADYSSRVLELEEQIRNMNGKVETLEEQLSRSQKSRAEEQKEHQEKVAELDKKVSILQEAVQKYEAEISQAKKEQEEREKEKAKAIEDAKSNPKDDFEIAETLFEKKEWKKAILSYENYRSKKPKAKKVPEATYKIGVCFQELGLKDEAKAFYDEVIAKFPKTREAEKAQIRLKKVK